METQVSSLHSQRIDDIEDGGDQETYTISQLSQEFKVTPRALRFYEDKGLLTPARRGQMRVYSRRDRARLSLILRGKRVGLSLAEIKEILDLYNPAGTQDAQLRHVRVKFKERIKALEQQRLDIDDALERLRESTANIEAELEKRGLSADADDAAAPAQNGEARSPIYAQN